MGTISTPERVGSRVENLVRMGPVHSDVQKNMWWFTVPWGNDSSAPTQSEEPSFISYMLTLWRLSCLVKRDRGPRKLQGKSRPWREVRWEQLRNGEWALALMYNDARMGGKWKLLVGLLNYVYEFLSLLFFEANWLKTSLTIEQSITHIKLVKNAKAKSTLIPLINS